MDCYKTVMLLLLGLSFTFCSDVVLHNYIYISSPKTWKDAQRYCREKHTDLATFESMEDLNQLTRPADVTGLAWIGLHDDTASWKGTLGTDSNSWRWSTTGQPITSQYHNWRSGEPNYLYGHETCVTTDGAGLWNDVSCETVKSFICYKDFGQNQKTYEFISTRKTWSDAQTYCRQNYADLAVITNSEENTRVQSLIPASTESWIGLYRVPWTWSDKSPSTFRRWKSGQPNNLNNQHCVAEDDNHLWIDDLCHRLFPFICHEDRKSKIIIKMKMKSTADLTDPAVNEQILQQIREMLQSQGVTDFKLRWTTQPRKVEEKPPKK